MRPPVSMMLFTTLSGAAQGWFLALFVSDLASSLGLLQAPAGWLLGGAVGVVAISALGLLAATFHLGHPGRAWRAVAMWRTSWLSREVIVLPLFIVSVALWGLAHWAGGPAWVPGTVAALLALALYLCTGMIYAAVRAIRQWAHPVTPLNFLLIGLASGSVFAAAWAAWAAPALVKPCAWAALGLTVVAAASRGWALRRNLTLTPLTTLQTAVGVRHPRIQQKSQGATGGSFNTREFFHGRTPGAVRTIRWLAAVLGFGAPVALLLLAQGSPTPGAWLVLAVVMQSAGLLAERWSFFAEGQHTQNLYYQTVS